MVQLSRRISSDHCISSDISTRRRQEIRKEISLAWLIASDGLCSGLARHCGARPDSRNVTWWRRIWRGRGGITCRWNKLYILYISFCRTCEQKSKEGISPNDVIFALWQAGLNNYCKENDWWMRHLRVPHRFQSHQWTTASTAWRRYPDGDT